VFGIQSSNQMLLKYAFDERNQMIGERLPDLRFLCTQKMPPGMQMFTLRHYMAPG
jgi:hypothetical protein